MHRFAYSKETPEMAEHKYNRVRNFQQICMWAGLALILAAAATFIIPRWDNIQRNLNNGTQTSRLILPQEAGITLAFFISIDNEVGES
ncbi:MAG: hypothetical protein HZC01_04950 [Candidatus Kerfeldbacteria bacterium]|nr:hypothetical protein [Candidatus Kerfeldbacteria bacterium]